MGMRAGLQVSRNTTVRLKRDTVKSLHMRRGGPTSGLCLRRRGKTLGWTTASCCSLALPVHRPHVGDVKVVRARVRLRENSLHKTFMHTHTITLQC